MHPTDRGMGPDLLKCEVPGRHPVTAVMIPIPGISHPLPPGIPHPRGTRHLRNPGTAVLKTAAEHVPGMVGRKTGEADHKTGTAELLPGVAVCRPVTAITDKMGDIQLSTLNSFSQKETKE